MKERRHHEGSARLLSLAATLLTLQSFIHAETLSTLQQVCSLPLVEGAKGLVVRAQGTVTYYDSSRNSLYIQQGESAVFVRTENNPNNPSELRQGSVVEVVGITAAGIKQCSVRNGTIKVIGEAPMPRPLELDAARILTTSAENRLVKIKGWIPTMSKSGNRLTSQLVLEPGRSLDLSIIDTDNGASKDLTGTLTEVIGVLAYIYDLDGNRSGGRLLVSDSANTRKMRALPVTKIGALNRWSGNRPSLEPVRMRARVVNHNLGDALVVHDPSGNLRVPFRGISYFNPGSLVEIFAWRIKQKPELVLTNVVVKLELPDTNTEEPTSAILTPANANTNLPTLTQAAGVRRLTAQEASRGYPVRIRGTITYYSLKSYLHFIQDDSAGIYLDMSRLDPRPELSPGQLVEVEGFSGPGGYAPTLIVQNYRILDRGEFPAPEQPTYRKLRDGGCDSQWVLLKGVVRNQWLGGTTNTLVLSTGEAVLRISIASAEPKPETKDYIDSVVEVRGVCTSLFDERRRLSGIELITPDFSQVRVIEPGPGDPFKLPVKSINDLFQFSAGRREPHRTRLMGVVTLRSPDGSFYLQDGSGGIQVQTLSSSMPVQVGDTVDVAGFPVALDKTPLLQDSMVGSVRKGSGMEPLELKPDSAVDSALNGILVRLTAQVLRGSARAGEEFLAVQFGQESFDVLLDKTDESDTFSRFAPGTVVRLTGVYIPRFNAEGKAQSFELKLRSLADVEVLSRPSWWTLQRTLWVLAGSVAVLGLALLWVRALHRQVTQRTQELYAAIEDHQKTEVQLKAEIAERKRMEKEVKKSNQDLLVASRHAGMAEVATGVLHNVGNVLNSVNVSSSLVAERLAKLKLNNLIRAAEMVKAHQTQLDGFLSRDAKGQQLGNYLAEMGKHLTEEQKSLLLELESLRKNVEHIKEIVAMQQNYARVVGVVENVRPADLVEDALRLNEETLVRHRINVERTFETTLPEVSLDKHKALQVLVNLISNAKKACTESGRQDKRLTIRVANGDGRLKFSVIDNGVGIPAQDLASVFNHGFTTRKDGHGFGLHSGALTAKEMGGSLVAQSDGPGCGATFTLEIPAHPTTSPS